MAASSLTCGRAELKFCEGHALNHRALLMQVDIFSLQEKIAPRAGEKCRLSFFA